MNNPLPTPDTPQLTPEPAPQLSANAVHKTEESLPRVGRSFGWMTLFLLVFLLAVLFYVIGYSAVLGFEQAAQGVSEPNIAEIETRIQEHLLTPAGLVGIYLTQCLMLIPLVLVAAHFPQQSWQATLSFNRFRARDLGFWSLIWLVYMGVQYLLTQALNIDPGDFMRSLSGSRHLPAALVLIICAPLLEELIFRGYLFKAWRNTWLGLSGTLLLTSMLFTCLHLGQYGWTILAMLFSFSIILGLAREKSGSLWVPIIIHSLNNLVAGVTVIYMGWL